MCKDNVKTNTAAKVPNDGSRFKKFAQRVKKFFTSLRRDRSPEYAVPPLSILEWSSYEEIDDYREFQPAHSKYSSLNVLTSNSSLFLDSSLPKNNIIVTEAVIENENPVELNSTTNSNISESSGYEELDDNREFQPAHSSNWSLHVFTSNSSLFLERNKPKNNIIVTEAVIENQNPAVLNSTANSNISEWSGYEEIDDNREFQPAHSSNSSLHVLTSNSSLYLGRNKPKNNIIVTEAVIENQNPVVFHSTANSTSELKFEEVDYSVPNTREKKEESVENDNIERLKKNRMLVDPKCYDGIEAIGETSQIHEPSGQQGDDQVPKEIVNGTNDVDKVLEEDTSEEMFYTLKRMRDIECVKLNQSSNVLKAILEKPDSHWKELLLAETILLENELRYKLIANKIREINGSKETIRKKGHTVDLVLSSFEFEAPQQMCPVQKVDWTEFFALVVSHETELFVTKAITAENGKLIFPEKFTLKGVDNDILIKLDLYSIKLKTEKTFSDSFLKKKSRSLCPMFNIYYENVHTSELHQSKIVKPTFSLCGSSLITKQDLNKDNFTFSQIVTNSPSGMNMTVRISAENVNLKTDLSSFLALGQPNAENNVVSWDRKWCVLEGSRFSVYNYPQHAALEMPPVASVDLKFCLEKLSFSRNVPKRKSFVLKAARPASLEGGNYIKLKHKNNFVLDKYYLAAENQEDFCKWTRELEGALNFLADWNQLIFAGDYYLSH